MYEGDDGCLTRICSGGVEPEQGLRGVGDGDCVWDCDWVLKVNVHKLRLSVGLVQLGSNFHK
ncbi:hypothetical protein NQ315_001720 [Exocentrus adspersus]|uniref:Uncharacterized protein n=1 Tax=Exocentrus adspersus TaxID=1586481 RepID=A0AAV8WAA4_9CUCU|nr:hypothetical protein NQ315_001720 [Exocentrus adspersus]